MEIVKKIRERAQKKGGRVVLPEGEEERTIAAAERIVAEGIARVTLLGDETAIREEATRLGLHLKDVDIIFPETSALLERYVGEYHRLREKKGVTIEDARKTMIDPLYYGAMMVRAGEANGYVSGAAHATADVLRATIQIIGLASGITVVSGAFLMVIPHFQNQQNKLFLFADCAVVPDPDPGQLASIAVSSARTFKSLAGEDPIVAVLSFSTKGSAQHQMVEKVKEATRLAQQTDPKLKIDGELQADAAIVPSIAEKKASQSTVAGRANVLIFPDLNAGNIAYKLVQRLAGAEAIGPVLQGLAKPANDLSRGCSVEDIVNVAAMAMAMA